MWQSFALEGHVQAPIEHVKAHWRQLQDPEVAEPQLDAIVESKCESIGIAAGIGLGVAATAASQKCGDLNWPYSVQGLRGTLYKRLL